MGLPWGGRIQCGPHRENYRCYMGWVPTTGAERISDTVVLFPPRKYTYDLPAPPTQEEVVQEAAKSLGDSLRTLAKNNPKYTHLYNFSGLQQMSDIINSAAKNASESKTQERKRVTPPKIPGGKRVGPNIIEDDSEDTAQQLRDKIKKKGKRDNRLENSNVERDKTYNRPLGRATHRYPTGNIIQQVHREKIKEERAQLDEPLTNENIPPFLLNAIIDDNTGDVDIKALIHGIEVLENKVNAIICPTTGNQLEYRHLIQDPATKAVCNPEMAKEVDR